MKFFRAFLLLLLCAGMAGALDLIRRNLSFTLEAGNDPILQFTNEGEANRVLTLRILVGDSSYRYRADFDIPTGENRFLRVREILEQLGQRYPEIKKTTSGILQIEYDGAEHEIKTRIVNLNPRSGVLSEATGETPGVPVLKSLDPASGSPAGGTVVTIYGENFTESTSVKFGGAPAMRSLQSKDVLVAVAPQHAIGAVDVEVSNGRRSAKLPKAFRYETEGPMIFKIVPEEGPSKGGTRISIQGKNFQNGISARWDGRPVELRYQGSDLITLVTPPGASGAASLEILNPDGKNYLFPDAFRYKGVPNIVSISPDTGLVEGGYTVTVNGADFEPGASVLFGGQYGQTTFLNPESLAAVVPKGESGVVDVTVTTRDGEMSTLSGGFLYNDPPVIRDIFAEPQLIVRNTTSHIHVNALDPEIGPLEYSYRVAAGAGTVVNQGEDAVFNSANVSGRVIVEVTVFDQYHARGTATIEILVQ